MSLSDVYKAAGDDLFHAIDDAVLRALRDPKLSEPNLVARLMFELVDGLNQRKALFEGCGVRFNAGGVFVHQSPTVHAESFPDTRKVSVEIGDLLLVTTLRRKNGSLTRTALLLQAKKGHKVPVLPNNENQHHLYSVWPKFTYRRTATRLRGLEREVTEPLLHQGAKYLLFPEQPDLLKCARFQSHQACCFSRCNQFQLNATCVAQATPSGLAGYRCFISEVHDFIFANAGRPFVFQPPGNNTNWDQVVTDLMSETANQTSKVVREASKTRGSGVYASRGVLPILMGDMSDVLGGVLSGYETCSELPPSDPPPDVVNEDGPHGGVSILEFVVREEKDEISTPDEGPESPNQGNPS